MAAIRVPIVRWVDDYFPGWVECFLTDAYGTVWSIVEKLPVVSSEDMREIGQFPPTGFIACAVIGKSVNAQGQTLCRISTKKPWGIEAVDGTATFTVRKEQTETIGEAL